MSTPSALRKELKNVFTDLFEDVNDISIFEQNLPKRKYESDEKGLFPFILIEVDKGNVPLVSSDDKNTCDINIVVGVDEDENGQPEALVILGRIILYLTEHPIIANKYTLNSNIEWSIGKDETEPYEYGVIDGLSFELPRIQQIQNSYL